MAVMTEALGMDDCFILSRTLRPCFICGEPTIFIEMDYECPLHPGPCEREMDRQFWKASAAVVS